MTPPAEVSDDSEVSDTRAQLSCMLVATFSVFDGADSQAAMSSSTELQNQPAGSSGSLLGSWLPWLGSSSKASASDTSPAQQPPAAQSGASDHQPEFSEQQQGDAVDLTGQWEKDTAASDMDAYARQVEMLHMSR